MRHSRRPACRIAVSRRGITPTCAACCGTCCRPPPSPMLRRSRARGRSCSRCRTPRRPASSCSMECSCPSFRTFRRSATRSMSARFSIRPGPTGSRRRCSQPRSWAPPNPSLSLNAALLQGGISIRLQPGTKVEAPIEILSILSGKAPSAAYTRSYVDLGEHASATIVERHAVLGAAKTQGHQVLVFALGDGASLEHAAKLDVLG